MRARPMALDMTKCNFLRQSNLWLTPGCHSSLVSEPEHPAGEGTLLCVQCYHLRGCSWTDSETIFSTAEHLASHIGAGAKIQYTAANHPHVYLDTCCHKDVLQAHQLQIVHAVERKQHSSQAFQMHNHVEQCYLLTGSQCRQP